MSRHTDSSGTTCYAAGMAWTADLHVYAVRCDACGRATAYPRDTPERAENATRHRAGAEGWRMENDNDRCPEHNVAGERGSRG